MGARPSRRLSADAVLLAVTTGGLVAGGAVSAVSPTAGHALWAATTITSLTPAVVWVVASIRGRRPGVDVIAVLALVGTLIVGEYFAGAMVAVMLASGRALEARARARAAQDLQALIARVPRDVHRYQGREVATGPLDRVSPGDLLLVKPGEVVPVDGLVESGVAVLDESALTGEALPVERLEGTVVRSGVVNAGGPFDLRATASAQDSTYAGIVRLVEQAGANNAPFVRMADRYALGFLPAALAVAGVAWASSGELARAVAVLVVATPCPLILAAPVAIVAGLSRAARHGVVIKGGAALERLAGAEILLLDKTGTLTVGRPTLVDVVAAPGARSDDVVRWAASLEQFSPHLLASAVVNAARRQKTALALPSAVEEIPGNGARGLVEGRAVAVGKLAWAAAGPVPAWARAAARRASLEGLLTTFVSLDGCLIGGLVFDDPIRPDARRTLLGLRRAGIRRIVMLTGDRTETAQAVGAALGLDDVRADCAPADKVESVGAERRHGTVVMVGDGMNDAPALAAADLGVAMGARGSPASSEAADVVLTVDRLGRLGVAMGIARRAHGIARQSVMAGMALSLGAMFIAASGQLPPAAGAVVQELIDLAAILNALRALGGGKAPVGLAGNAAALGRQFAREHVALWPRLGQLRTIADNLGSLPPTEAMDRLRSVFAFLAEELWPHEEAEDVLLYPALASALGGDDVMTAMSRAHVEIGTEIRRFGRVLDDIGPEGPDDDDVLELRRLLYGLHAVLRLHFTQEDEGYFALVPDETGSVPLDQERGIT